MRRFVWLLLLSSAISLFASPSFDANSVNADAGPNVIRIHVDSDTPVNELPLPLPNTRYNIVQTAPGESPEADFSGGVTFTNDGEQVVLTNRTTNNVSFFDAETMELITIVDVGVYPQDVAVSDDYAVVPCLFSDEVWVINLEDYTIAATFDVSEQPAIVKISPNGRLAFIGCDVNDELEVIDLFTMTHTATATNFFMRLNSYWLSPHYGRYGFNYTNFEVLEDNATVAFGFDNSCVRLLDAMTDTVIEDIVTQNIETVYLSGDNQRLVGIAFEHVVCIDLATYDIVGDEDFGGSCVWCFDTAVSMSGDKALIKLASSAVVVRFETNDYEFIWNTSAVEWIRMSPDGVRALAGGCSGPGPIYIVDLDREELVSLFLGVPQSFAALSPVEPQIVAFDSTNEGVSWFDYEEANVTYLGRTSTGSPVECDSPMRLAMTPDGQTALAACPTSKNVIVLDMATGATEQAIELGISPFNVAITSDGAWAVVVASSRFPGMSNGSAFIIDMSDYSVVAELDTGDGPYSVIISPDNQRAYVTSIWEGCVTAIDLAGAASTVAGNVSFNYIGLHSIFWTVDPGMAISEDGRTLLVCAAYQNVLKVINTATMTVEATLQMGDYPTDVAYSGDGQYALVTNYFESSCTICHIDGMDSSVMLTIHPGENPVSCTTNPVSGDVGVVVFDDAKINEYSLPSGTLTNTYIYPSNSFVSNLEYDSSGNPIVLGAETLSYADEEAPIVTDFAWGGDTHYGAADFVFYEPTLTALVCAPCPDMIFSVSFAQPGELFGNVELEGVTDYSGVTVELVELGQSVITGPTGDFTLGNVRPGVHTVEFTIDGWDSVTGEVEIEEGETVDMGTTFLEMTPLEISAITGVANDDGLLELQFTLEGNPLAELAPAWLYQLEDGQQNLPDLWVLLTGGVDASEPYLLGALPAGDYVFATVQEYPGGVLTEPVISDVIHWPGVGVNDTPEAVTTTLLPNSPNPFNPSTTVRFSLAQAGDVSLRAYDIRGRLVETLVDTRFDAGEHAIVWNAADCASGVYLLRLEADGKVLTRRAVLLK